MRPRSGEADGERVVVERVRGVDARAGDKATRGEHALDVGAVEVAEADLTAEVVTPEDASALEACAALGDALTQLSGAAGRRAAALGERGREPLAEPHRLVDVGRVGAVDRDDVIVGGAARRLGARGVHAVDPRSDVLAAREGVDVELPVEQRHDVPRERRERLDRRAVDEGVGLDELTRLRVGGRGTVTEGRRAVRVVDPADERVTEIADLGDRAARAARRRIALAHGAVADHEDVLRVGARPLRGARTGVAPVREALLLTRGGDRLRERRVPLGLEVLRVGLEIFGEVLREVVGDGPHRAVAKRDRARARARPMRACVVHVADRAATVGALGVRRARHERARRAALVALLPDVVAVDEAMTRRLDRAVLRVVAGARRHEVAEALHAIARVDHGLVVARRVDLQEGVADRDLRGGAVEVVLIEQVAGRDVAEPLDEHLTGRHEGLVDDVHVVEAVVAVFVDELRGVRVPRAERHLVRDRLDAHAIEHPPEREEIAALREVARPIDAEMLALIPGAVRGVLLDDVQLLTGRGVVLATDVEVRVDAIDGDGGIRLGGAAVEALPFRARDPLVAAPREEEVLLDVPLDLLERPLLAHEGEVDAVRRVDDRLPHVEGGADELRLPEGPRLHAVDRGLLLGAAAEPQRDQRCGEQAGDQSFRHKHARFSSFDAPTARKDVSSASGVPPSVGPSDRPNVSRTQGESRFSAARCPPAVTSLTAGRHATRGAPAARPDALSGGR